MSETKNIVVIGGSVAGGNLVNELVPNLPGTYRILLIDALGYATWPPSSTRAAVVPGWEKRVSVPLSKETIFPAGSIHEVIAPNKVVELRESSVVLEHPFEGSTEVPFWKAIIATGAQQPSPMRPVPGSTEQEYLGALTKLQEEFTQAKKILIVGAGAVGLELAGDLRERFPETSITLVHSGSSVLNPTAKQPDLNSGHFNYSSPPTAPKLSKTLEGQLKGLKIDLVFNDKVIIPAEPSADVSAWDGSFGLQSSLKKVKLQSGKELEADFVFVSIGNKPNVSLVENADKGAITQGLVAVDEYLKVVSQSEQSILTANYYAIGDCASSPGWKTAQGAQLEAVGAAANILAEVKGKPIKPFSKPKPYAMFIPLGTTTGSGTLDFPFIGTVQVPAFGVRAGKGKKLLVEDLFIPRFKGSKKPPVPALPA